MDDVIRKNIEDLLSKVENGDERFRQSAMLNQCVQALARDVEPIGIITQLIDIIDKQQTELTKYAILYGTNHKE